MSSTKTAESPGIPGSKNKVPYNPLENIILPAAFKSTVKLTPPPSAPSPVPPAQRWGLFHLLSSRRWMESSRGAPEEFRRSLEGP